MGGFLDPPVTNHNISEFSLNRCFVFWCYEFLPPPLKKIVIKIYPTQCHFYGNLLVPSRLTNVFKIYIGCVNHSKNLNYGSCNDFYLNLWFCLFCQNWPILQFQLSSKSVKSNHARLDNKVRLFSSPNLHLTNREILPQPLIGSCSNFKFNLRWQNHCLQML